MTDTLIVYLSGDALNGDTNATITVNGVQVGGTLDVSAVNASDNVQPYTFTGNFGANPQVSVSFVNQANISPLQVRTLYLDGFGYDGILQLNDKQVLNYDQTDTYPLTSTPQTAERVTNFLNAIGVEPHIDYLDTSYGLANGSGPNLALITQDLAYLGITHIRVALPDVQTLPWLQSLAADGIKFDVLMPEVSSPAQLPAQIAWLDQISSSIASIEGPNETDTTSSFSWNGQSGYAAAAAYQQALWNAVKADPKLAGDPIYCLSLGTPSYSSLGNLSAYATDGTAHVYYPNGVPPAAVLKYNLSVVSPSTPSLPTVITETNYATAPGIPGGVSNAVQASYDTDLLMDATKDGVSATYFYELLDEHADLNDTTTNENHYGLFNSDGTPKPAATALHNLTTILSDTGSAASTFTPSSLKYSVSGLPASGNTLLLEKSNGAYDIVVWAEPDIWNATTNTQIAATPRQVTVTLPNLATVNVYDPLTGTSALAQYGSTSSVTVTVTDHPVVIEVEPPAPPTSPITLGSGPDVLALSLSEDAFQGDAQFTISIAGKQIGGIQTVTASHSAAATQTFDVLGDFAVGSHTATIDFLNDLHTPGVGDRNLYVNGATLDGVAVANSALTEDGPGPQTFSFGPNAPVTVGSGPDVLALSVSEDAFQGDAQFTASIDGKQIGGTLTAEALHSAGATETFKMLGNFGAGTHTASVDFLNDLYTPGVGDRNLYLTGATMDGGVVPSSALTLMSAGTQSFSFIGPTQFGSGSDVLSLLASEDAFQGNAQFTVSVDGHQIGGTQTATASHSTGAEKVFDVFGSFAAGTHTVGVDFLNDLYTPGVGDRNLYVRGATFDSTTVNGASLALMSAGTQTFTFTH